MKNGFLMMGIAALALASCAQEEVVETSPSNVNQREIGFEMFVGNPTKAASDIITNDNLNEKGGFVVYGGYDNSLNNVYAGATVTEQGGVWKSDVTRYWDAGKTYNFAAYAPAALTPTVNGLNLDFAEVTINAANQHDFIYATATQTTDDPLTAAPDTVSLSFKHMLSMIKVTISSGFDAEYKITVSDLKISGMNSKGKFAGATPAWSEQSEVDATGFTTLIDTEAQVAVGETAEKKVTSDEFIVMPQDLSQNVTIEFFASVTDHLNNQVGAHRFVGTLSGAWEMGNRYNYTVTLKDSDFQGSEEPGEEDMFPIIFEVEDFEWNDWTDTGFTVQK